MMTWPKQSEVLSGRSVYGNPKSRTPGVSSAKWEAENLVYVKAPFVMTFAGQKLTSGMKVHRHCAASLARIMDAIWAASGKDQKVIDHWGLSIYSGGHVFRLMRDGVALSMHSYGCAVDFDRARNDLFDRTPRFAEFPEVLKAFADEGWRWGGDWNGNGSSADERRADGMHWQATA
ncbi:MAG: M15 family metallopeptidase [Candidatus Pacebacteria bacterium]|nr:M15 family metallopeptidase [Candidatus Paceibacterota bacterium]